MVDAEIERIHALLDYDPDTGVIKWKRGTRRVGGTVAGTINEKGYIRLRCRGKFYYAHRVAFALIHARWPVEVDHVNGDRSDNRADNLRECTRQQNQWNARKRGSTPSSQYKGVYWNKQKAKWQARICENYRSTHLGFFDDEAAAGAAYLSAAQKVAGDFSRAT